MTKSGYSCNVATCKNYYGNTKNRLGSPVSYYRFPKDPEIRKIWIIKCKRRDSINPNTGRICSEHFTSDQFEDDVEARIMGLKRPKKLLPGSVPTQKLNKTSTPQKKKLQIASRKERVEARSVRKDLMNLIASTSKTNENESEKSINESLTNANLASQSNSADNHPAFDDSRPQQSFPLSEHSQPSSSSVHDTCCNLNIDSILQENKFLKTQVESLQRQQEEHLKKLKEYEIERDRLELKCKFLLQYV